MNTVNEMLDRYMLEELPKRARRTQVDYLRHIETLRAHFGTRLLDDVKPRDIGQFLDVPKGKIQRAKIISVLSSAYNLAVGAWWAAERNPCKMVIKPKNKPRTRYITDAEFYAVREICNPRLQVAMDLALITGQRQGDLLALRWDHIDVNNRVIHLRQSKTGKRFGIYITPELEEVLVRAKRLTPDIPRAYVIRTKFGDRFSSEGFRQLWSRFIRRAVKRGIIKEHFRWHDIRSKTASDTPDIEDAAKLLGHQNSQMTKSVYDRNIRIVQPLR